MFQNRVSDRVKIMWHSGGHRKHNIVLIIV